MAYLLSSLLVAGVLAQDPSPAPTTTAPTTTPPPTITTKSHKPYVTAKIHPPTNWQSIKGDAVGNFEFLGALCFPEKKGKSGNSVLEIEVLTKTLAPPDLAILMYDDQPESFDMITREPPSINKENSCYSKMVVSKSFSACKEGHHCSHGLTVKDMSHSTYGPESKFCPSCHQYQQKVAVDEKTKRIWYFVAAQCDEGSVRLEKYNIASSSAIDCKVIRTMYQKNADAVKTWGYSFVIALLMVGCLVAYVFMIRCYYSGSSAEGGFSADQLDSFETSGENDIMDENNKDYNSL